MNFSYFVGQKSTKSQIDVYPRRNLWSFILSALRFRLIPYPTLFGALLLATIFSITFTETNVSAASLTLSIPESISLSINTQNGVTYKASSKSNITIKTDAYSGYTLNIKSKDGTNTLKSSEGKTISSISSALDNYESNGATNTWAFLPDKLNSTSNTKFQPGPKSDILLGQSSSSNSTPATYPISIAAKIDNTQPTGTYKNTFTITATANPVPYTFSYNSNGGSSTPSTQSGTGSEGSTKNLTTSTPSKSGYTFQGWCTVNPGTSESCPSSGTKYSSGAAYTLTNSSNTVTFYAIWKADSSFGSNTMQGWTGCSNLSQHSTVTLTDARDNNTYTVAKLKDGKCWMTQNLRLGNNSSSISLNSTNSDVGSSFTLPRGSTTQFNQDTIGVYVGSNTTYGNYYTGRTVIAHASSTISAGDAPYSICPKGWKLPTRNEMQSFVSAYNSNHDLEQQPPVNLALSGESNGTKVTNAGTVYSGLYTSTVNRWGNSCNLYMGLMNTIDWNRALPIRCIAR